MDRLSVRDRVKDAALGKHHPAGIVTEISKRYVTVQFDFVVRYKKSEVKFLKIQPLPF